MKKRFVYLATIMIFGSVAFFLWSKGSATVTIQAPSQEVKGISTPGVEQVQTADFSFSIPDRFVLKTESGNPQPPLTLQRMYVSSGQQQTLFGDQLAITAGKAPTSGLEELSDVMLRKRSSEYKQLASGRQDTLLFERSGTPYEIGMFSSSNGRYVAVVVSGPVREAARLKSELLSVASSLVWR